MNRLIIIGNGFDLARNLKTRYSDFIRTYIKETIQNSTNRTLKNLSFNVELVNTETKRKIAIIAAQSGYYMSNSNEFYETIINYFLSHKYTKENYNSFFMPRSGSIFERALKNIRLLGWADIEAIYYKMLCEISMQLKTGYEEESKERLHLLNSEMEELKKQLIKYLLVEQKNATRFLDWDLVNTPFINKDFTSTKDIDCIGKKPENCSILNFNYTNIFNDISYSANVIKIHGDINNPNSIIFGYGDEKDKYSSVLEKLNDNEYLKYIKSFGYLQNSEYNKLIGFIEQGQFQICIVGHSCSLSDKTLLNYIFQHPNCKSIKIYYHEKIDETTKEKTDNFNEILYNISRNMDDKIKLRERVINKSFLHTKIDQILEYDNASC